MRCYYILNIIPYKNYRMNVHLNARASIFNQSPPSFPKHTKKRSVINVVRLRD